MEKVKRTRVDLISSTVVGLVTIAAGLGLIVCLITGVNNELLCSALVALMFMNFGFAHWSVWIRIVTVALFSILFGYQARNGIGILTIDAVAFATIVGAVFIGIRQAIRCAYRSVERYGEGEGVWNWHIFAIIIFWFIFGTIIGIMMGLGIWWLWIVLAVIAYAAITFAVWLHIDSDKGIVWLALIQSAIFIGLSAIGVFAF